MRRPSVRPKSSRRVYRKVPHARHQKARSAPVLKDGHFPLARVMGYARVSTEDQNLDVQLAALRAAGVADADLFVEKISAVSAKRPQFDLLMKMLERGDTFVFHALSRIGREVPQIIAILKRLSDQAIAWRSVTEPYLDAATASGRLMVNITSAMAQFERDQIVDRTKRGMDELRRQGMYIGRPRLVDKKDIASMRRLRSGGRASVAQIAKRFGVKPSTVYAYTSKKKA